MTPPAAPIASPVTSGSANGKMLCHCLKVTADEVRDTVDFHGCQTVEHVTATCGAGGGCTACHHRIRAMITGQ